VLIRKNEVNAHWASSNSDCHGYRSLREFSEMNQDETVPVSIVALRADAYSSDGKNVIISLKTKFSTAERKYSVPLECFYDLIVDLQRLNASTDARSSKPSIQPAVPPNPATKGTVG
jgi:hypothetical protein